MTLYVCDQERDGNLVYAEVQTAWGWEFRDDAGFNGVCEVYELLRWEAGFLRVCEHSNWFGTTCSDKIDLAFLMRSPG